MKKIFEAAAMFFLLTATILCGGCDDSGSSVIQRPEGYSRNETPLPEKIITDVYFDATVSMKGYTTLAAGNVYRTLPDILSDIGGSAGEVKFFAFGEEVKPIEGRNYRNFSSPEPYNELITAVHNVIDKSDPAHLSIIVTDLFESNADWSNISQKIRDKFFANHMAVGVIGIKNSFKGEIFDVGLNAAKFDYDSYDYPYRFRPFYLLVIGQENSVKDFMEKFKQKQTLQNEMGFLLLSENLSEVSNDFSKMNLQTMENFFSDNRLALENKSDREFGIDKFNDPAMFTLNFKYQPPLGACPINMSELKSDIKIFALDGEEWTPLNADDAKITLTPAEGDENTFEVKFEMIPENNLQEGKINFVHAEISPNEKGYLLPEWVTAWNMANVDVDPENFIGSKTVNLVQVLGSLKSSVYSATRPALVNINFVIDAK